MDRVVFTVRKTSGREVDTAITGLSTRKPVSELFGPEMLLSYYEISLDVFSKT